MNVATRNALRAGAARTAATHRARNAVYGALIEVLGVPHPLAERVALSLGERDVRRLAPYCRLAVAKAAEIRCLGRV